MKILKLLLPLGTLFVYPCFAMINPEDTATRLFRSDFKSDTLGKIPGGWKDTIDENINPSWGIDGNGLLRPLHKSRLSGWWGHVREGDQWEWKMLPYEGMLLYNGLLGNGVDPSEIADGIMELVFMKTPEADVHVTLLGRALDEDNYYGLRFSGQNKLEFVRVLNGEEETLNSFVSRSRYSEEQLWKLVLKMKGQHLKGMLFDQDGLYQASIDVNDSTFRKGFMGMRATTYAAVEYFAAYDHAESERVYSDDEIRMGNQQMADAADVHAYPVVRPAHDVDRMLTSFSDVAESYDIIVVGGGTGGWATAVQATRMGARVLLVEEADWIGGQMAAAGVTSMDEAGLWYQFPVRERGIYREFHESMVNYYYTLNKDPFRAYHSVPEQHEGGYEPRIARAMMFGFIQEARNADGVDGGERILDVVTGTRVTSVMKDGSRVIGATLEHKFFDPEKASKRSVASHILVDATEYGDIIPLTGAGYRVGTTTSDVLDLSAPVQDYTYLCVLREYPEGVPEDLRMTEKPPRYDVYGPRFRGYRRWGSNDWPMPGRTVERPLSWRRLLTWRGMADTASPMTGRASEARHTRAGMNLTAQDFPVSVATVEDQETRLRDELEGIYHTMAVIYYMQNELGIPWSVANDEGYDTPYNRWMMKRRGIPAHLMPIAVNLPQWPYVRESRRIMGIYTLRAHDLSRLADARHFPTSLAMGDYYMDLHGTEEFLEEDLDKPGYDRGEGPFQVPFEVFVPKRVDGFIPAEKNISQSRLVSGATRLQPITMLTGQAAGTIAALAARKGVQPRQLNPIDVQWALLDQGSTLVARYYADIPWGTPMWRTTQLLALYGILDRPGPLVDRNGGPLRRDHYWGVDDMLTGNDIILAMRRLSELCGQDLTALPSLAGVERIVWSEVQGMLSQEGWLSGAHDVELEPDEWVSRSAFAEVAVEILLRLGRPELLND